MAILMQTTKIIQAVILMLIIALAASCAAGKQYSALVFGPRAPVVKDSQPRPVRFLGIEDEDSLKEIKPLIALEKNPETKDSITTLPPVKEMVKPTPVPEPVVKTGNSGGVRTKRTRNDQ
jgi:hypothetical protein